MTTSTAQDILDHSTDEQFNVLMSQAAIMNPDMDFELLERSYTFSRDHHSGQERKSGAPYFDHCYHVALTLISLHLDSVTIAAGLLHDVVEDVEAVTLAHIKENFGEEVGDLVDGVTKIAGLTFQSREDRQAEYFRKMLVSMASDIRVIIIKLADRLHNMRTLESLKSEAIERIAIETRDIYAPLAHRFGMAKIKSELEDLSLKYLDPEKYEEIDEKVDDERETRERHLEEFQTPLEEALREAGIPAVVKGRAKHFYSIYSKMTRRGISFENIHDLLAVRVITESVRDCYHVLGIIHDQHSPMSGRFKDYIAKPKMNMYQSLHTTVIAENGRVVEVQIRTGEMDRVAEVGIAAHWLYKEDRTEMTDLDSRMAWLREALDWESEMTDSAEFMQFLRMDLYDDAIFIFTPNGDLKELPAGASALDFAFAIHTDIGLQCSGTKVNGRMVPLGTELSSGDTVEVFSSANRTPSYHWLDIVKTSKAKSKIRGFIKKATHDESAVLGEDLLNRELKRLKLGDTTREQIDEVAQAYGKPDSEHLYAAIGQGELTAAQVGHRLIPVEAPAAPSKESVLAKLVDRVRRSTGGVKIRGVDNMMLRYAQCCQPVPGDPIVGFITRGRGVTVHRRDCKNIIDDLERRLPLEWDVDERQAFLVGLNAFSHDRPGLLNDITKVLTDSGLNITHANIETIDGLANGIFTIEVQHLKQLEDVIKRVKRVKGVQKVRRTSGILKDMSEDGEDPIGNA
ncbi:MAG: bifunctional (p)ppGpp synthetase/guanosine-3',5'-bis(diphosphate) 3'-pyrophosphohydrolase [Candidatus Latescibacteria bacterium]|nr:bifunctional (p)ppGpp synthetase/guanosine-3',5'-bis(diphosphate) 3'-pyrophosphohydrolase [Candidatus Latescibacterota bacterium]